jgi:hypothetical protein
VRRLAATSLLTASCLLAACEARGPTAASRPGRSPSRTPSKQLDKQALYADASLVPTRAGERARRELALAGELRAALELLDLGPVHVDVELHERPRVIVVARFAPGDDPGELEAAITELAVALVPELEAAGVHPWLRARAEARAPSPSRRAPTWALVVACLGLGLSLGVTGERLRLRRRSPPRP